MTKLNLRGFYFTTTENHARGFFFLTHDKYSTIVCFEKDIVETMTCGLWQEALTEGSLRKKIREDYLKDNDLSILKYMGVQPKSREVGLGENNPLLHASLSKAKEVISDLGLEEVESKPMHHIDKLEVDYVKNKTTTIRCHTKEGNSIEVKVDNGAWVASNLTEEQLFHMKQTTKFYLEKL